MDALRLLVVFAGAAAVASFFLALVCAARLMGRLAPGRSRMSMAFEGWRWLDRRSFAADAAGLHRIYVAAFFAFLGAIAVGIAAGIALAVSGAA